MNKLFQILARSLAPTTRALALLFAIATMATSAWATDSLEETGGFVTSSSQLAFKNATLGDLTADTLHGRFSGAWAGTAKGSTLTFNTFATPDANTKTCEAKLLNDGYVKGVLLTFTQNGDDVEVQMTGGKYLTGSDITASIASGSDGSYSVCHLRLSRTPELYGGATVTWEAGEFATTKVGIDGNEYTITLPASGMSIDETTKNLVVAASGATTGATIDLPDTHIASALIKYSSLSAVASSKVTLATAQATYNANGSLVVVGPRTTANSALTMTGYWDNTSENTYAFGTVPSLTVGSGYFMYSYHNDTCGNGGTYAYAGTSPSTLSGGGNTTLRWTNDSYWIKKLSIGGPITTQSGVVAWPNVAIEKVALFIGSESLYKGSDIVGFSFVTTEATITAAGTYTLSGENPLFETVSADESYVINVNESATLNIPAATTVNMITFNVAEGKTLTLTGSTLTAAGGIKVTGAGSVSVSSATALAGTLKGDGTVVYNGVMPSGVTLNNAAWTGTVEINTISAKTGLVLNNLGSVNSTVRVSAITDAYFNDSGTVTANPTLEIGSGGLTIAYGNGGAITVLKKLTGSGNITITGGAQAKNGLVIQNHEGFSGQISNTIDNRWQVTIGNSGTSAINGKMIVNNGYTANISNGKTWSFLSGFEVSGILAFNGTGMASGPVTTVNGSTLDLSGFTGTAPAISGALTLVSGTTIKLPASTTLPYQIASSGSGWIDNVTVQIGESAGSSVAVCLKNGSIVRTATSSTTSTSTSLGALAADANYLINVTGDATITIDNDVSSVGYIAFNVSSGMTLKIDESAYALDCPYEIISDPLTIAADAIKTFTAGDAVEYYQQIGSASTGNGAISTSGTTIAIDNASSLSAGNYTLARWTTPQKLSSGYGYVETLDTTGLEGGLSAELLYCADRIVLRVYDSSIVPAEDGTGTLKIWPYGDSITEGYNMGGTKANYRVLLAQKLTLLGFDVEMVGSYDKINGANAIDPAGNIVKDSWKWHSAKHGATAGPTTNYKRGNLCENVDTLAAQVGNPDVVLLHIGVNDLAESAYDQNTTFVSLTNVVQHLVDDLPNSKIVVSTALRQLEPYRNNTEIDAYNVLIRGIMADMPSAWTGHVLFADLATFVDSQDSGILYAGSGDNLHPDWWGHNQMAEGWLSVVANQFTPSQQFNATKGLAVAAESLGAANKAELADYRRGFKRYGVINVPGSATDLDPSSLSYFTSVDETAAASGIARVGYFVEYVRTDNNAHKWVWVDMDAFGSTISELGLPSANHQQVVNNLHVKSNHNGINDVAADDNSVRGFVEFSPYNYGGANSGITGAPDGNSSSCDWNDTLSTSGSFSCMQVHRISPPSGRGGQVLFAFNNWNGFDSNPPEFGIGNCSQHFYTTAADACSFDYTHTRTLSKLNASAYTVKTIEVWTNSDKLEFSNDLKGSSHANDASFPATEVFKITMPASAGTVKIDSIVLGSRGDKSEEIPANAYMTISTAMGTVATSLVINGDGNPQFTDTFADGGYKQTYTFGEDCLLEGGTSYILSVLNPSGEKFRMPAQLENYDTADAYSVISNTVNVVNNWRITQTVYASKVYESTLTSGANTFGGLTFSPTLPPDCSESALLVNVPDDTTSTLSFDTVTTVGSIRFNIPSGSRLTVDPTNLTAGKVIVYGPGELAFVSSPTFTAFEVVSSATISLSSGQMITTTGAFTVDSGATLTLSPATIAGLSASLVSAASISGEIALTAPDESSDYSIVTTSTAVTLRRTTKSAFAYEAYPNGGSPSGWFSAWNNTYSDNFSETSLRVGPSATIPYVYHVSSSSHPYYDLTARSSVSFAVYADVSQMQSSKGIIACFGNSSNGLLMYRNGDWIVAARISGGSVDRSWVPGVAVANGYHLYTVTYNSSNGKVAVYRDGNVSSASDGSAEYPHFASGALNAGFQFGTTYGGSNPTGFNKGEGLAVAAMRGYDVVLQQEEVAVIAESFPATDGNVTWNVVPDNTDNTVIVTSTTFGDSNYIGQSKGTLTIPEGSTVNVKHIRVLNNNATGDRATVNIAGTLNITSMSSDPNVWYESGSNKGILWGHWHGQATYNITGSLIGENAYLETVYTAEAQTININGGTVSVKGIYAGNANSTINLTNGGTLEVAEIPGTGTNSSGVQQATAAIALNFGYGTYRQKATGTVTHTMTFTGTQTEPTTLDPYDCEMTVNSMSGTGYVTVADSSDGGNGKVYFNGSGGTIILTDANATNIDLTGYTGTVLCQGTESDTIALLDNFAGTVYFTESVDATGVNLSGATVHIADNCTFTADAGKEGVLVLGSGATVTLNVTQEVANYEGYFPTVSGSGTISYYQTDGTPGELTGADHVNGNNLMPYYNVWVPSANGENNTISADAAARWRLGRLPDANKNVAFKLSGNTTVTIDATITFKDVQVYGTGILTIQQSGDNVMTVGKELYTTANAGVEIDSGLEFADYTKLDVECAFPSYYVAINCGTAESPFVIPTITGSGMLYVTEGHALESLAVSVGPLFVDGELTVDAASSAGAVTVAKTGVINLNGNFIATSLELNNTATVNVGAGTTLTVPTLSVSGGATVNMMAATSVLSGTTSLSGVGTVNWNGKNPDLTLWTTGSESTGWRGTNSVCNINTDANRKFESWGNQYSVVKVSNVGGWVNAVANGTSIATEVRFESGAGYAFNLNNGNSYSSTSGQNRWTVFDKVSGSGVITNTTGTRPLLVFKNSLNYTGSIRLTPNGNGPIIAFSTTGNQKPATAAANDNNAGNRIYVMSDGHAVIGDGNDWYASHGITISGTNEFVGAATMTGTVALDDGATLKFDDIGSSGSPKMLTLSSALTFASGTVNIAFGEGVAETLYDGATLIDWTTYNTIPGGMFAFDDSSLSDDWVLFKESTGLKVYDAHIQDEADTPADAGTVSVEDGALKATVTPTGAAVTLPERITKLEVSVTDKAFGTLTAPGVTTANVVVKCGSIVTTGAYKISTNEDGVITFAINDAEDAQVEVSDGVYVKVKPEVDTTATPMESTSSGAPQFTIKTIPGLWYAIEESASPTDGYSVNASTIRQADTTSKQLPAASAPTSNVKYYKIAVDVSRAALTPAP